MVSSGTTSNFAENLLYDPRKSTETRADCNKKPEKKESVDFCAALPFTKIFRKNQGKQRWSGLPEAVSPSRPCACAAYADHLSCPKPARCVISQPACQLATPHYPSASFAGVLGSLCGRQALRARWEPMAPSRCDCPAPPALHPPRASHGAAHFNHASLFAHPTRPLLAPDSTH